MCETFKACFEKLEGLTNKELDRSVVELVAVENRNVALVIAHLSEISSPQSGARARLSEPLRLRRAEAGAERRLGRLAHSGCQCRTEIFPDPLGSG